MFACTKKFSGFPFAHRQHNHDGHCALIHGHNWDFEFEFHRQGSLDENNFVVDFGKLKWLRDWLNEQFDHTLVLNSDDPQLECLVSFLQSNAPGEPIFAKIKVVPSASAEGLAQWIHKQVSDLLFKQEPWVTITRVTVFEDEKNSATYYA